MNTRKAGLRQYLVTEQLPQVLLKSADRTLSLHELKFHRLQLLLQTGVLLITQIHQNPSEYTNEPLVRRFH